MPEIARFFGIIIRMFAEPSAPHHRPHFHAYYQSHVGVFAVDEIELMAGELPRRRQRDRGELGTKKRGKPAHPQAKEVARLQRQVEKLQAKLDQARTIIAVQKKRYDLLGLPAGDSPKADGK